MQYRVATLPDSQQNISSFVLSLVHFSEYQILECFSGFVVIVGVSIFVCVGCKCCEKLAKRVVATGVCLSVCDSDSLCMCADSGVDVGVCDQSICWFFSHCRLHDDLG